MIKKDLVLEKNWQELLQILKQQFGKKPQDLNAVLFLIGIQELGQGMRLFTKEEKQDLMHIAICKLMSMLGYYTLAGHDNEGWPIWKLVAKIPRFDLVEQEQLIKMQVLDYFEKEVGIVLNRD